MNYINKLASFAVLVIALSGCDFNEDFCIRNGELVAWCDFSGIMCRCPYRRSGT